MQNYDLLCLAALSNLFINRKARAALDGRD